MTLPRITVSERSNPDLFVSKHWLHTKTVDDKEFVNLSGIAMLHWKGTGQTWNRNRLLLVVDLPHIIPAGKLLKIEQWTPFITLNAIYNKNHAVNAGWAVDEFWGPGAVETSNYIHLWATIAIRDIDGYLYRVAYSLSLVGRFVDGHSDEGTY